MDEHLQTYILSTAQLSIPLSISPSPIPHASLGLFALAPLPVGSEVFRDSKPLVYSTHPREAHKTCDFCFASRVTHLDIKRRRLVTPRDGPAGIRDASEDGDWGLDLGEKVQLTPCSRCGVVVHCSDECRRAAWNAHHRYECEEDMLSVLDISQRLLLRVLAKYKRRGFTVQQWAALRRMSASLEERGKAPGVDEDLDFVVLVDEVVPTGLSHDDVFAIYAQILENSLGIKNPPHPSHDSHLGAGLYILPSLLNHSCEPNVYVVCEGTQLQCRTYREIAAGEELLLSYCNPEFDVDYRRELLKSTHFINCNCNRCILESTSAHPKLDSTTRDKLNTFFADLSQAQTLTEINAISDRIEPILFPTNSTLAWPAHTEPLPQLLAALSRAYTSLNLHDQALRTNHCLTFRTSRSRMHHGRAGILWIETLYETVRTLRIHAYKSWDRLFSKDTHAASRRWTLFMMYLVIMKAEAEKWTGAGSAFAEACKYQIAKESGGVIARESGFNSVLVGPMEVQGEVFEECGIGGTVERFRLLEGDVLAPPRYALR